MQEDENLNNDPELNVEDPNGQPGDGDGGNGQGDGKDGAGSPTDFVDFNGVKISKADFERAAKENFKDHFDAYENRDKWQRKLTQDAQALAEAKRKASEFDRLMADQRRRPASDPLTQLREESIANLSRKFPQLDPGFVNEMVDMQLRFAEVKAQTALNPFLEQQGQAYEKEFLRSHPDVIPGSEEYERIREFCERGYDAEDAYEKVFKSKITQKMIDEAVKKRDEEARRKLKQSPTRSATGSKPKAKTFAEAFEQSWADHGDN